MGGLLVNCAKTKLLLNCDKSKVLVSRDCCSAVGCCWSIGNAKISFTITGEGLDTHTAFSGTYELPFGDCFDIGGVGISVPFANVDNSISGWIQPDTSGGDPAGRSIFISAQLAAGLVEGYLYIYPGDWTCCGATANYVPASPLTFTPNGGGSEAASGTIVATFTHNPCEPPC